jgi:hypothetical protein
MSEEKKHMQAIDFRHLGGKKVGHPVPVKAEKEISFESIGGRVVRRVKNHAKLQESTGQEDDIRE